MYCKMNSMEDCIVLPVLKTYLFKVSSYQRNYACSVSYFFIMYFITVISVYVVEWKKKNILETVFQLILSFYTMF